MSDNLEETPYDIIKKAKVNAYFTQMEEEYHQLFNDFKSYLFVKDEKGMRVPASEDAIDQASIATLCLARILYLFSPAGESTRNVAILYLKKFISEAPQFQNSKREMLSTLDKLDMAFKESKIIRPVQWNNPRNGGRN